VTYTSAEGRQQLLDAVADAAERIGLAVAALTAAYEQLDEVTADRLEEQLFRPLQAAYGRARRAYAEFAARHDMPARAFALPAAGAPARGVKGLVERAVEEARAADAGLAELQDSMLPVEVGDRELRESLGEIRTLLDQTAVRSRELLRTFGR
jgi:hypothetical protein